MRSISVNYGRGVKDENWIPVIGNKDACVLTQDYNLYRLKHQRELCKQYNLGVFFLRLPAKKGYPYWKIVEIIVKHWRKLRSRRIALFSMK